MSDDETRHLVRTYMTHLILDELPQAEELMRKVVSLLESQNGPDHESLLPTVDLLAGLLWSLERREEALAWTTRAQIIRLKYADKIGAVS